MDGLTFFLVIIGLVWGFLNIILFFKIWSMTNDVNAIKEILISILDQQNPSNKNDIASKANLKAGDVVINMENGEKLVVAEVFADGDVACKSNKKFGLRKLININNLKKVEELEENN